MTEEQKSLSWLCGILDVLRKECPWDSIQTVETLRHLTEEEVFELSDAIAREVPQDMCKELGDMIMHIVFYSKIAEEKAWFNLADVIDTVCSKLISRHPHISLPDRDGVRQPAQTDIPPAWEKIKMKEGRQSVLEGVPANMPPLLMALRMQDKAAGVGFEYPSLSDARDKVVEELKEFDEALGQLEGEKTKHCEEHASEELGDLLSAVVAWGRRAGLNADDAMVRANLKFKHRFSAMERMAMQWGTPLDSLDKDSLMRLWNDAKKLETKYEQ